MLADFLRYPLYTTRAHTQEMSRIARQKACSTKDALQKETKKRALHQSSDDIEDWLADDDEEILTWPSESESDDDCLNAPKAKKLTKKTAAVVAASKKKPKKKVIIDDDDDTDTETGVSKIATTTTTIVVSPLVAVFIESLPQERAVTRQLVAIMLEMLLNPGASVECNQATWEFHSVRAEIRSKAWNPALRQAVRQHHLASRQVICSQPPSSSSGAQELCNQCGRAFETSPSSGSWFQWTLSSAYDYQSMTTFPPRQHNLFLIACQLRSCVAVAQQKTLTIKLDNIYCSDTFDETHADFHHNATVLLKVARVIEQTGGVFAPRTEQQKAAMRERAFHAIYHSQSLDDLL